MTILEIIGTVVALGVMALETSRLNKRVDKMQTKIDSFEANNHSSFKPLLENLRTTAFSNKINLETEDKRLSDLIKHLDHRIDRFVATMNIYSLKTDRLESHFGKQMKIKELEDQLLNAQKALNKELNDGSF